MVKEEEKISSGDSKRERNTFPSLFRFFRSSSVFSGLIQTCRLQLSLFFFFRIQGESEFPFPAIARNTSLEFPSRMDKILSMAKISHKKKNIYSGEYVQMGIAQLVFITLNVTKLILRLKICTLRIKTKCFAYQAT